MSTTKKWNTEEDLKLVLYALSTNNKKTFTKSELKKVANLMNRSASGVKQRLSTIQKANADVMKALQNDNKTSSPTIPKTEKKLPSKSNSLKRPRKVKSETPESTCSWNSDENDDDDIEDEDA